MARIQVAIAVEDDALTHVEDVVQACSEVGFRGDSEQTIVGVFTGTVELDRLGALRAVRGVAALEIHRDSRLPAGPQCLH